LFGSVQLNSSPFPPSVQFVWAGVNTAITLRCAPKQPDPDLLEEVVSVRLQMNSGAVRLW
ncbi:hypothetical protein P3389_31350, partial [Vibrio parahaemolyticus]|nr:hypothetical protein [Vibrio parahaemolyticus]